MTDRKKKKKKQSEKVGDFYVHLVHGPMSIDSDLSSSAKLLTSTGKPTVIHFYDGG